MKYTTRWLLTIIIVLSLILVVTAKDFILFMLLVYPLVVGWVIGECLSVPEKRFSAVIRSLKNTIRNSLFYRKLIANQHFENDVQYFRELNGWTKETLAFYAECSIKTIDRIEKRKYIPDLLLATKLSNIFETEMSDLFVYHQLTRKEMKEEREQWNEKTF